MPNTVRLADLTTVRLGGPARSFAEVVSEQELREAVAAADGDILILGGGSNVVVADDGVDAAVIRIGLRGVAIDGLTITVGAGENWDDVVRMAVEAGLCGLAPLSGIPGSAGATPVQNVGAYGSDISDVLVEVTMLDQRTGQVRVVGSRDLRLGYRTSLLRGQPHWIVTSITMRLHEAPTPVRYAELARALSIEVGQTAPEASIREAVLELRRRKGMVIDPADPDTRSTGSFFTNPILAGPELAAAERAIERRIGPAVGYPRYPADQGVKLSAAWLIENAGFGKGFLGPGGRVRVSTKHTLALVNIDGTTRDLLDLARTIADGVRESFDVDLRPEPVLVGVVFDS